MRPKPIRDRLVVEDRRKNRTKYEVLAAQYGTTKQNIYRILRRACATRKHEMETA